MNRALKTLLEEVAAGEVGPAVQAKARALLRKRPAPVKRIPAVEAAKVRRAERKESAAERRREVYAAVDARARAFGVGLLCEKCRYALASEHDHFWGRRREESVETVWALCRGCHRDKTANKPSRIHWLIQFGYHAQRHGYASEVVKVNRAIALEDAQHPEARSPRREESRRP